MDNGNTATIAYNGNGAPLTLPFYSTTTAAGYDPEDRLETTGSPNGPSSYSRYDADGLRAWNYFTLLGVSYFLNDGGQPVEEEDYTGNGGYFNLFGATGLELRFSTAGGSPTYQKLTAYTYDPQGNLVQPVALFPGGGPARVRVEGSAAYDGFGLPAAQKVAEGQFDGYSFAYEPFGFGGQYGYYTDNSGLLLLTHRYYNPFTGEFVNRDPIGYKGGINLYGLAGNNPVNESDPSGFDPDPDDPTGLPGDNDGHWGGRTGHPGMQRGTSQSNTARRMTRSLLSTLWDAGLGIFNLEGRAAEAAAEGIQALRAIRPIGSPHYSVSFEAILHNGVHYPGRSAPSHFAEANRQLHLHMQVNPEYAQQLEHMHYSGPLCQDSERSIFKV